MPKIRSHRGAMKRFKTTKKGQIKRNRACTGHLKEKKSSKKKRALRKSTLLNKKDVRRIKKLMA
jgi:large subunit ribosomal protein L35